MDFGPRNDSTRFSLSRFGAPQKTYAPLTPSDSAEYNATTGQVTRTISPTGMDVRYTWSAEKLVKVQNVTLNTQDSIEYETQYSLPKHVISSTSAEQWLAYDQTKAGWPLQTTRIGVSTATPTTHYADAKGRDTTVVDPGGHSTKRYFAAGGLQNSDSVRAPNGQVTRVSRDAWGRVVSTRAPNGVRDSTYLDVLNRPVWVAGPLANDTTRFQHDALNNVTSVTDATGQVYTYQRNALGWVTALTHPGSLGSDSTKYDIAGNPVWVRTRANRQISLDYDVLGRLTKKWSAGSGDTVTFAYDPAGRWVAAKSVVGGSTVSTDTIFTDSLGRTIRERTNRPVAYWDVSSSWGNVQRGGVSVFKNASTFAEHAVSFMPDAQGRPSYISTPGYSGNTRLMYNADQLRDTIVFPTGLRETWVYTPDHALMKREYNVQSVRDAFDRTYRTDSLDRLVQRGLGTAGKFQTFDYDVDGRLANWIKKHQTGTPMCVNVSGGWGYDCSVGGVATDTIVTATYDNAENPTDLSAAVDPGNRLRAFNGVAMTTTRTATS